MDLLAAVKLQNIFIVRKNNSSFTIKSKDMCQITHAKVNCLNRQFVSSFLTILEYLAVMKQFIAVGPQAVTQNC